MDDENEKLSLVNVVSFNDGSQDNTLLALKRQ
jgi:hypothetical protein